MLRQHNAKNIAASGTIVKVVIMIIWRHRHAPGFPPATILMGGAGQVQAVAGGASPRQATTEPITAQSQTRATRATVGARSPPHERPGKRKRQQSRHQPGRGKYPEHGHHVLITHPEADHQD